MHNISFQYYSKHIYAKQLVIQVRIMGTAEVAIPKRCFTPPPGFPPLFFPMSLSNILAYCQARTLPVVVFSVTNPYFLPCCYSICQPAGLTTRTV